MGDSVHGWHVGALGVNQEVGRMGCPVGRARRVRPSLSPPLGLLPPQAASQAALGGWLVLIDDHYKQRKALRHLGPSGSCVSHRGFLAGEREPQLAGALEPLG